MHPATALLNDGALFLANVAIASVVICMSAILASIGVRRKSLPLRHTVLLSSAFFLLFSPAVILLSGQLGWGLIPFEMGGQRVASSDREATAPQPELTSVVSSREPSSSSAPTGDGHSSITQPADSSAATTVPPLGEVVEYPYRPNSDAPIGLAPDSTELSGVFDVADAPSSTESLATSDDKAAATFSATVVRWNWQHLLAIALMVAWALGSLWMLLRLVRGLLVVRKLANSVAETADARTLRLFACAVRHVGCSKRLAIFESSMAPAPLSLGLFRPIVLLPTGLSETLTDEQLLSVLTHEVAHIARCDNQTSLVQQLAAVVFWWNPLLHSINHTANQLREHICDDYVVNSIGHGRAFAEALVKVAEWCALGPHTSPAVTMLIGESDDLPRRVHRLADTPHATVLRLSRPAALTCAAVAFCGLALLLIPILRPASAAQNQKRRSDASVAPQRLHDSKPPTFTTAVAEQLSNDDGFHEAIVVTVLSKLEVQQPALMTAELSRRIERRFRLIAHSSHATLDSRDLEWRQKLIASLAFHIQLEFRGDDNRMGKEPSEKFFDRLKTLEWKLWLAANRLPHHEFGDPRMDEQQDWLRKHILALPEQRLNSGGHLYRHRQAIAGFETLRADPLNPICKTAMSDKQFAEFRRKMQAYNPASELIYVAAHTVRHEGWIRFSSPPKQNVSYPNIQLPFKEDVQSLSHGGTSLRLAFGNTEYAVPARVRFFVYSQDADGEDSAIASAERQAATEQRKALRKRLAKEVAEAKEKRDRALHSHGDHAAFEQRYLRAKLRLDLLDLEQNDHGLDLAHLPPTSAQRIAELREATRVRWGRPVDGLQVGFGRVSDRTVFSTGEDLVFQLYVRNALDVPLKRTVKYKSPKTPSASIDCGGRIIVHASTDGELLGPTELQLQPGEIQPLKDGECLVGTAGLSPGDYYIEAYLGVTWRKEADTPRVDRARTPGWTEIPTDLALRFTLTGDPANSAELTWSGEARLRTIPGISWGLPVQGLQSGVRYVRGMLSEPYNNPTNWQWSIGDDVRTEILVRNVSHRPRTISYTPDVGADVQILDASETNVTRYDDYSALMRWDFVRSEQDTERNIQKLLQPGEITVVGRSDFEVQQLPTDRKRMRDFPKANRIWLKAGEKYWCRPSVTVSFGAAVKAQLRAGQIRLWMADKQLDVAETTSPVAPDGVGSVLLSYDSFGSSSKATFVFTPMTGGGEMLARSVSNGGAATEVKCPAGNYRVTRLINVRSGRLVRNVECNQQIITVAKNEQTKAGIQHDPTHLVSAKGRIEDYAQHKVHAAFVTVFKIDDKRLNTGEPADYFDFLAERKAIFVTACDDAGEFTIEPLPPGRYAVSVAAFRITDRADGQPTIMLPWHVGCATFSVLGHSQDAYWYPNKLKLRVNWNEPTWLPRVIPHEAD